MGEGAGGIQNTSLATIILESRRGESSESEKFPNNGMARCNTTPPVEDEYTHLYRQCNSKERRELITYRRVAPLPVEKDPVRFVGCYRGGLYHDD